MDQIQQIPLDQIIEIDNYRKTYDQQAIDGYAASMKADGFKSEYAITVVAIQAMNRKTRAQMYAINTGHCRTRAARQAGLTHIAAIVKNETDPIRLKLDQLGENENRCQPNDIDVARGFQAALDLGATIEQIGIATGKHKDFIERRLNLLKLVPDAQDMVAKKQFPIMYANELVRLDTNFQRIALSHYRDMKSPNLEDFRKDVDQLFTKQNQCSLFDMPIVSGKPIEQQIIDHLKIERPKSREELEAELDATKKSLEAEKSLHTANKAKAVKKLIEMQQENAKLKALLAKYQPLQKVS